MKCLGFFSFSIVAEAPLKKQRYALPGDFGNSRVGASRRILPIILESGCKRVNLPLQARRLL
jgi:hypothetical protein